MDFNIIIQYITENCLILIPALWVIGSFLKATPKLPNWLIPYVLTGLGIFGGCGLVGFNVTGFIQGILASGAAVLGNQLLKQFKEK